MYNRNVFQSLNKWKLNPLRKPLILRGARQIGKTTAVHIFGKQYDHFLSINLEVKAARDLFERGYTIHELVPALFFYLNKPIQTSGHTLLFMDEIQNSPAAAAMLRYFYEERNDIHVIAAGSLLETLIDRHVSFPVGRVEYLFMYPMSFSEYLEAAGEVEARAALEQLPCPHFVHDRLLHLFHQYTLVGGMPEAVGTFLNHQDMLATNAVYQNLMIAFMDDVEKYSPNKTMTQVMRHVIAQAPLESGARIRFEGFGHSHYRSREVGEALRTLEKVMLIKLVYPTTQSALPAQMNYKKSPRLQFLDIGLVNYTAHLQNYYSTVQELHTIYLGRIIETVVGQELLATHHDMRQMLKFWVREKSQSNAEIDYVIPFDQYLIPVEVKSGKAGTLRSLMQYMEVSEHPYAVRLYGGKMQVEPLHTPSGKSFYLLNLPYYLVGQCARHLSAFLGEYSG